MGGSCSQVPGMLEHPALKEEMVPAIEMIYDLQPTGLYLTDHVGDHGERLWGDEFDAVEFGTGSADPLPEEIVLAITRKRAVLSCRGPEPCWRHPGNGRLAARLVEMPVPQETE
jgi:hypothetical protein